MIVDWVLGCLIGGYLLIPFAIWFDNTSQLYYASPWIKILATVLSPVIFCLMVLCGILLFLLFPFIAVVVIAQFAKGVLYGLFSNNSHNKKE